MSGIYKTRYLVQHEFYECKYGLNKAYVTRSKNGIMINVGVSVSVRI